MTQTWPEAIDRFLAELTRWAPRTNLVGSSDPQSLARHVEDSLAGASALPRGARVVDLGSGAGFPGIPIAIARPDLAMTLVEIRERRVHFLRHAVRTVGIACRIERRRIEDPESEPFDYALMRAVTEPARAVALALPWLRSGGEAWIWSGPDVDPSLRADALPLASSGMILRIPRRT
jgi:16S rRNA (guanine527-N7)-methyltransferase